MRSRACLAVLAGACLWAAPARAQRQPASSDAVLWPGAVILVVGAAILDDEVRAFARDHQSRALTRLADGVDPLGRARYIVPSLAATYVVARLGGERSWSDAVLRIGVGYVVADAIESALKWGVGRHRPDSLGDPWRFRPFNAQGEWHSFPSAHVVHAFAIAAGIAAEADRPWVSVTAYGGATLIGLQRVYRDQHWPSDVAASAVLAIVVAKATNRWMRRRGATPGMQGLHLDLHIVPDGLGGRATMVWSP